MGYAHWVCQTLLDPGLDQASSLYRYNILQMDAVAMATVGLDKVTGKKTEDSQTHSQVENALSMCQRFNTMVSRGECFGMFQFWVYPFSA